VLGHLDHHRERTLVRNARSTRVAVFGPDKAQEIEADSLAVAALLATGLTNSKRCADESASSVYYSYFTLGAHLFFEAARFIEIFASKYRLIKRGKDSHPSVVERVRNAEVLCEKISDGFQIAGIRKMAAEFSVLRDLTTDYIQGQFAYP
jgi:hypothetical protein